MKLAIGEVSYIQGIVTSAHWEALVGDDFEKMSREEQEKYLRYNGNFICDAWEETDCGDICKIKII